MQRTLTTSNGFVYSFKSAGPVASKYTHMLAEFSVFSAVNLAETFSVY